MTVTIHESWNQAAPDKANGTDAATSLLRLQNVQKVFYTDEVETHALSGIHLMVRRGEYVSIEGPSGCGKSTLLSILGLLDSPSGGEYWLDGKQVQSLSFAERARIRNREIGFIFQSFNLIGDLTVSENVELPLTYRGMPATERKQRVQESLERVSMAHRAKHLPSQLSGGQQQRVAVARALAGNPLILLADEPTGNLDSANGEAVMDLLKQLHQQGATICMVTHDPRFARFAERTVHLFDGRVVDEKREPLMDVLIQDLRFALRSLRRSPAYTAVVVAVMALGIGVNTMVFSIVYAVMFRPLAVPEPERLVLIQQIEPKRDAHNGFEVSGMNFLDFRRGVKSVEAMGAYWDHNAFVTIDKEAERLYAATVTHDLFDALGVKPILGHGFTADEEVYGQNWTNVVISHKIWTERYRSDPNVLGKTLRINGRTRTIIGVMPKGFRWPEIQDFWIPMGFDPKEHRGDNSLTVIGRLKTGTTAAQADAEVRTIMAGIAKDNPKELEGQSAWAKPLRETMIDDIRPMMLMLLGAVVFVLLIACANVANLMLARAASRRREISLRLALGATRGRVVRQLLTESVVIAVAGASLGVLLAHWGNSLWISTIPLEMPMWLDFSIDAPILLYTIGISVIAGLLFGFAPALHATETRLVEALREGSAQAGSSNARNRLRASLVVAEIALSLVLLVGAGLMVRSFMKMTDLRKTVHTDGLLTAAVLLPVATYPEEQQKIDFFHAVLPQIAMIPGVSEVSMVQTLPINRGRWGQRLLAEGTKFTDPKQAPNINYGIVAPGYFHVIGIPLLKGRDFNAFDGAKTQRVVIVSQSLAKQFWGNEDPLGRRVKFTGDADSLGWAIVVGMVGDVVQNPDDHQRTLSHCYVPHDQNPVQWMSFVVRAPSGPGGLAAKIREIIHARNPDLALVDVRTMAEHIRFSMWQNRLFMSLFTTFAILALLIAGVGIYGVMAYNVAQRTQEIGIRMALGADRAAVVRMVVGQAMRLTVLGAGIGLAAAYAMTRVMASVLFNVSPDDPPTYAGVALILAVSSILAAWLPAHRATRVDPMVALRYE